MPLTTSWPLREIRFQRAWPSFGLSCWRLKPGRVTLSGPVTGPRNEPFTGSSEWSSTTRSPEIVYTRIFHGPLGNPRKSTCVPVGSVALGVRSHDDGRSSMLLNPRYGFGTTHTDLLAAVDACGATWSASTAERRPCSSPPSVESPAVTE